MPFDRPTMENSSAKKSAISSPASGELLSGLNSMSSVSMTRRIVSTSPPSACSPSWLFLELSSPSPSRFKVDMSSRSEPLATEAGNCLAKLLRPRIAARRSSNSVADCRRPHSVSMVAVAVCIGGVLSMMGGNCCPEAVSLLSHSWLPVRVRIFDTVNESKAVLLGRE